MENLYFFLSAAITFYLMSKLMPKARHERLVKHYPAKNVIYIDFKQKKRVA